MKNEKNNPNKYFYDFGEEDVTEELPPAIEELSKKIKARKEIILQQRANAKKIKNLRAQMQKGNNFAE